LTGRRVRFTATARRHIEREHTWWLENRDYRERFATELEQAIDLVAVLPGAGTPYTQANLPGLRRLYVRLLGCHLYYTFDERDVIVRALWGARRDRGPTVR
jgi:plasmid stabilization system protein ParE